MFGIGWGEALVIGVLMLLVIPTEQLPTLARDLGKRYGQLRRTADELKRAFFLEADRMDAGKRAEELKERRKRLEEDRARRIAEAKARGNVSHHPEPSTEAPPVPITESDDPEAPAPRREPISPLDPP